jgi:hypothetical protein
VLHAPAILPVESRSVNIFVSLCCRFHGRHPPPRHRSPVPSNGDGAAPCPCRSTLANYTNSLCNLAAHWWDSRGAIEEAAMALDPQPPDALLRLRAQAEGQSKQQQLYAKKPAN